MPPVEQWLSVWTDFEQSDTTFLLSRDYLNNYALRFCNALKKKKELLLAKELINTEE